MHFQTFHRNSIKNVKTVKSVNGMKCHQEYKALSRIQREAIQKQIASRRVTSMKTATLPHIQLGVTATCHSTVLRKMVLSGPDSERKHIKVC